MDVFFPNCDWLHKSPPQEMGVITGGDHTVECLLPWWLHCLRRSSDIPVVFFDFGLSPQGRDWASKKHLKIVSLNIPAEALAKRFAFQETTDEAVAEFRKKQRTAWFTKPFALLKTPFQKTLWLDLDCEVIKEITPLFQHAQGAAGCAFAPAAHHIVAAKRRAGVIKSNADDFNAGVIPYVHGSSLIKAWAEAVVTLEGYFPGDQEILSRVISDFGFQFEPLPRIYNWQIPDWGTNRGAVIQHWKGLKAKNFLIERVILKQPELSTLVKIDVLRDNRPKS